MNEMFSYIFGSLKASEKGIKTIRKALRNQARFNHGVATFALVITTYVILMEIENSEQKKRIEKLSDELEELKRTKGE